MNISTTQELYVEVDVELEVEVKCKSCKNPIEAEYNNTLDQILIEPHNCADKIINEAIVNFNEFFEDLDNNGLDRKKLDLFRLLNPILFGN
jgi:uncharacterized metal-binding protein YceD (DUF177 family)